MDLPEDVVGHQVAVDAAVDLIVVEEEAVVVSVDEVVDEVCIICYSRI